jgi:hypothetical protein
VSSTNNDRHDITEINGVKHHNPNPDLWFSSGIPVYYTNKTDHNDINKILLKVTFKHHDLTRPQSFENMSWDIYHHHHYLFMA